MEAKCSCANFYPFLPDQPMSIMIFDSLMCSKRARGNFYQLRRRSGRGGRLGGRGRMKNAVNSLYSRMGDPPLRAGN